MQLKPGVIIEWPRVLEHPILVKSLFWSSKGDIVRITGESIRTKKPEDFLMYVHQINELILKNVKINKPKVSL